MNWYKGGYLAREQSEVGGIVDKVGRDFDGRAADGSLAFLVEGMGVV